LTFLGSPVPLAAQKSDIVILFMGLFREKTIMGAVSPELG
jgi:hypothetical protein